MLYIGVRGRSLIPGRVAQFRLRIEVKDMAQVRQGGRLRGPDHGVNSRLRGSPGDSREAARRQRDARWWAH